MTWQLFDFQEQALAAEAEHRREHPDETRLAIVLPTGTGKGHPLDTEVPTPDGLRRWGDLVAGDRVVGSNGLPTEVLAIHDRGSLPTYRVTFTDGSSVEVDGDHLWNVRGHRREVFKTLSTAEIAAQPLRKVRGFQWQIPMVPRVHSMRRQLPLDPYVIGALIANGTLGGNGTVLTTPDVEVAKLVNVATECNKINDNAEVCDRYSLPGLVPVTRELGMRVRSQEKRIPRTYLSASVDQRIGLLHGLMDGDGSARQGGRRSTTYHTTSPGLAEDVAELVTSLGGTGSVRRSDRGDKGVTYEVGILLPAGISAFRSGRKQESTSSRELQPRRSIVSIEYVGERPIRCITVDADDHLYLITRRHIVTHNSVVMGERARRFADDEYDRLDRADPAGLSAVSPRQRVLVIVHTNELVEQLEATIRFVAGMSEWPITVGVVKANRDQVDADIIIGSRQTLEDPARRARISDVGLVIVDECHIGYTAYEPIMRHFGAMPDCEHPAPEYGNCHDCYNTGYTGPPVPALGFTATMSRSDGAGLGQVWQDVAFTRDTSWAIRRGYLVQPIGYRLTIDVSSTQLPGEPLRFSQAPSVQDRQLADGIAPERAVEKWLELAKDRPTILFAPLVRSARAFRDAFLSAGVSAAVVYGDMPDAERRQVIANFKAGHITVLCNAMVLQAGFDHPAVSCVMVMRPTQSDTLYIQMAGRGLRRVPGIPVEEQDCILISLADGVSDLRCHVDLSDRPLDPKAEGALTAMEDEWDIGKHLDEQARHWAGRVDATQFDPLVARSSKVWQRTKGGAWFVPISTNREYVFLVDGESAGTSIYSLTREAAGVRVSKIGEAPDVELAMQVAEDEATERGGDLGALVADRTRPWRKAVPGWKTIEYAGRLGLSGEVDRIMQAKAGGKAGKVSDLIRRVEASRSIDPMVIKIKKLGEQ